MVENNSPQSVASYASVIAQDVVFSQADRLHLADLLVARHCVISSGGSIERHVCMDPQLPQDNATSQVPEMERGLWAL